MILMSLHAVMVLVSLTFGSVMGSMIAVTSVMRRIVMVCIIVERFV